jgi:hypothetical protein
LSISFLVTLLLNLKEKKYIGRDNVDKKNGQGIANQTTQ